MAAKQINNKETGVSELKRIVLRLDRAVRLHEKRNKYLDDRVRHLEQAVASLQQLLRK